MDNDNNSKELTLGDAAPAPRSHANLLKQKRYEWYMEALRLNNYETGKTAEYLGMTTASIHRFKYKNGLATESKHWPGHKKKTAKEGAVMDSIKVDDADVSG